MVYSVQLLGTLSPCISRHKAAERKSTETMCSVKWGTFSLVRLHILEDVGRGFSVPARGGTDSLTRFTEAISRVMRLRAPGSGEVISTAYKLLAAGVAFPSCMSFHRALSDLTVCSAGSSFQ